MKLNLKELVRVFIWTFLVPIYTDIRENKHLQLNKINKFLNCCSKAVILEFSLKRLLVQFISRPTVLKHSFDTLK